MGKKAKRRKKPKPKSQSTPTTQWVSFRLPHDLLARFDEHTERLQARWKVPLNRTQTVTHLLTTGLDKVEKVKGRRSS